ncbi:hypothetical protein [Paraclostridium bifermentans]|uniref:hypothetical protein n=1 Tax=Paraclostridium bifermentans TaxID=1490 RepID=UPI00374FA24A
MKKETRIDELLKQLKEGSRKVTSEFRDENAQTKSKAMRFPTVKKETKKRARILTLTEIAIPFDPFTGKETDEYNRNCKYRPIMSTESAILVHKQIANENEQVKEMYMTRAGLENWDTSDLTKVTADDKTVFNKYRQPVVFSVNVVDINIPMMTGQDRAKQYKINVVRNPITDQIEGELPLPLKVNKLLNDRAWTARQKFEEKVKSGELKLSDKDLKEKRREFYADVVVSTDHPVNNSLCIELPLDNQLSLSGKLGGLDKDEVMGMLKLHKYSHNYAKAVKLFLDGTNAKSDLCTNFYEMDMICSDDTDPGQIGLNTTFAKADSSDSIANHKDFEDFNAALVALLDSEEYGQQLENIFQRSSYITEFTTDTEAMLIDALPTVVSLEDPRMSDKVLLQNNEIISRAFGIKGDEAVFTAQLNGAEVSGEDEINAEKYGRETALEHINEKEGAPIDITEVISGKEVNINEIEDDIE